MSGEPTERDVEALALELCQLDGRPDTPGACGIHREQARVTVGSDWYAERIAQARREGAANLVDRVARGWQGGTGHTDANKWVSIADLRTALRG